MIKLTKTQLQSLKKRYIKEGYKMALREGLNLGAIGLGFGQGLLFGDKARAAKGKLNGNVAQRDLTLSVRNVLKKAQPYVEKIGKSQDKVTAIKYAWKEILTAAVHEIITPRQKSVKSDGIGIDAYTEIDNFLSKAKDYQSPSDEDIQKIVQSIDTKFVIK